MASTRLVRKALRNRTVSKKRLSAIKRLTSKPVLKNVDVEQIKEEFANRKAKPVAKKETPVKEELKAVVEVAETPKAGAKAKKPVKAEAAEVKEEKKTIPKKSPAKKAAPKAKKAAAPKAKKKEDSDK